ncbi:thymidylate kinase [Aster yellows witches'-broom phytoplasma AYWB]|uniref:Thymidylate kinase n=2 Tax=16SrI (Aster yellows group) TaxID=3042590 RepID=Q2NJQ4_AYWBP|nr:MULTISPECIES: dTMP kinase [16SrI (Aster yellows group)]ABC65339.1 thymidylate kinase [Aster yellows witches'-broom phytoplasma AYWB]PEH36376.1 dTMP kinase [New Jersey aster yellows phytoplasma]
MKIIVFEGLDGSGKTTLIQKIRKQLEKQGHEVINLQGLGSSSIGQPLRDIFLTNSQLKPLTRYLLSFANMQQIQEEEIKPHLATNKIILIDRWLGSNLAYQAYPHNIDKNYQLFNLLNKQFIKPNMTVYLKIKPQLGLERKQNQKDHKLDVIETHPLSYFHQVSQGYELFLERKNLGHKFILKEMNSKTTLTNQKQIIKQIGEIQNGNNY